MKKLLRVKQSGDSMKPRGLWYAKDHEWQKWWTENVREIKFDFFYRIVVIYTTIDNHDKNKILLIKSQKDYLKLAEQFGYVTYYSDMNWIQLDWKKLSNYFGGIEIRNVKKLEHETVNNKLKKIFDIDMKHKLMTYVFTFDIDSGCIWNPKCISVFELIR